MFSFLNPEGSRLFPQTFVYPRHPGKPDPRWRAFEWKYVERKVNDVRYKLYFYEGEEWSAWFTEPRIAKQVEYLSGIFKSTPPEVFSYFLFTSLRDFRQANLYFVSEGVQGITSTQEATMAVPYWGEAREFDHVSLHELVHQFQVQKINQLSKSAGTAGGATAIPLWFIEGMAEYYSQHGVDDDAKMYLRDLATYPDAKNKYELPTLMSEGQMGFVHTYKVGQAKIDFLETQYGKGTAQAILEKAASVEDPRATTFEGVVARHLGKKPEELERDWQNYFEETYRKATRKFKQDLPSFGRIDKTGETIDYYDISPSGDLLAYREIDPMTGVSRIRILDRKRRDEATEVIHDGQPSVLSLYFFQLPSITITDRWIAYAVETANGPEIEVRPISRDDPDDSIDLGSALRIRLHQHGYLQASSIAISPDGRDLAFVGLTDRGWTNVYLVEGFANRVKEIQPLTSGAYSWRNLTWDEQGLLVASNRTPTSVFSLFRINPKNAELKQITASAYDQWSADARAGELVFQGWAGRSPQAHRLKNGRETRVTDVPTGLLHPRIRGGTLYALAFQGGRYRLLEIPVDGLLNLPVGAAGAPAPGAKPWEPMVTRFSDEDVKAYRAFRGGTTRLDGLFGFLGTGGVGGVFGTLSDLVRDYQVSGGFAAFGNIRTTSAEAFLSSQRGRSTWTGGLYRSVQTRLDGLFSTQEDVRTYLQDEYGGVGAIQYPINNFSFLDLQLRVSGVNRFDYSDREFVDRWQAQNPGRELMLNPAVRLGYDRIVYEAYTGPLQGFGILGEAETSYFPARRGLSERLRLDIAQYFKVTRRTLLALQGIAGATFGDRFNTSFFISSDDFFRAYSFGDPRLLGDYFLAGKGEVRFPIGDFFGFPPLRGLVSYDIGTIAQRRAVFGSSVTSAATWGLSLNLPPLSIALMFSYPIRTAPGPVENMVPHFTLRYLYL